MNSKAYWVGFNMVRGIGAVRLQALLDYFGDAQVAWGAPPDALLHAGLSQKIVENLVRLRGTLDLDKVMERLDKLRINVFTRLDDGYPRRLKEIDQPPPVLYVRGEILAEDDFAVAVVGTRRVTVYGRQVAEEVAQFLAQNGITVVSGLARGVDAVAHDSAIKNGGRTFAVLGSGVDRIYPPEHQILADRIIPCGALISDYAPGTPPDAINFPPRNRIISGLSLASVIIEAGDTSGALITATFAAEQGREVLAVPGTIHAPQSKGTNRLIQQGARPMLRVEDILDALKLDHVQSQQQARSLLPADAVEASILSLMSPEPLHIDEIQAQSGLSIDKVSATLTLLELKGMIRQVGGLNYTSVREPPARYFVDDAE